MLGAAAALLAAHHRQGLRLPPALGWSGDPGEHHGKGGAGNMCYGSIPANNAGRLFVSAAFLSLKGRAGEPSSWGARGSCPVPGCSAPAEQHQGWRGSKGAAGHGQGRAGHSSPRTHSWDGCEGREEESTQPQCLLPWFTVSARWQCLLAFQVLGLLLNILLRAALDCFALENICSVPCLHGPLGEAEPLLQGRESSAKLPVSWKNMNCIFSERHCSV